MRFFGWTSSGHQGEFGFLYVGRSRIAFESESFNFEKPRSELVEVKAETSKIWFSFSQGRRVFEIWASARWEGGSDTAAEAAARRWLALTISDFGAAEQEFKRLTAGLQPNPPPQDAPVPAQTEAAKPPPPPPKLALSTQPGNVGVYLDDEFKGISSGEGRLVVSGLEPGSHHLRLTVIGYKEMTQSLDLAAGETKNVEAKLEPAGPKPLALAEIEEALTNGLPPKGITKLVNQYGVDFALSREVEQSLCNKGADSDLLLAIATNKK